MLLPVPAAVASERVAAVERVDLLHFWLGLSATAAPPPSPPLPNVPIHFLVEDERLVGVVLDAGGCHYATTTTGGCLTISGATPILSVLSAPGRFSCLY